MKKRKSHILEAVRGTAKGLRRAGVLAGPDLKALRRAIERGDRVTSKNVNEPTN